MADVPNINNTLRQLVGDEMKLVTITAELTNATKKTIPTGLSVVEATWTQERIVASGTAADTIIAVPSATAGAIDVTAVGATGTTTAECFALGSGKT